MADEMKLPSFKELRKISDLSPNEIRNIFADMPPSLERLFEEMLDRMYAGMPPDEIEANIKGGLEYDRTHPEEVEYQYWRGYLANELFGSTDVLPRIIREKLKFEMTEDCGPDHFDDIDPSQLPATSVLAKQLEDCPKPLTPQFVAELIVSLMGDQAMIDLIDASIVLSELDPDVHDEFMEEFHKYKTQTQREQN